MVCASCLLIGQQTKLDGGCDVGSNKPLVHRLVTLAVHMPQLAMSLVFVSFHFLFMLLLGFAECMVIQLLFSNFHVYTEL